MSKRNKRVRKIATTPAKQKADVTGEAYSAGYQPIPHIWYQQVADLPPFTFQTIRAMLIDPEIRLNFATRAAPICGAQFGYKEGEQWVEGVKCKQPEIAQFIYRQLQRIWKNFLPAILRAQVWGWSGGEVVLKLGDDGLVEIDSLEPRHAMDVKLLKMEHERWGISVERVEDRGTVMLPFPYAWFHAYNAEDGEDYGVSAAHGAYSPFADKWFNGGAKDVRRLFMHKDAYGGVDLGYPEGETWIAGIPTPVPNHDIARRITEQIRSGGTTTRPSDRDENGNEKWPLTRATVASNPTHILDYPKDLDIEIRHGMEICDDVVSAESGAWAGKRVTIASFYSTLDQWVVQILTDLKEQIIDHLCRLNFGSVPNYEICHKPLAEQAMEQQANAGPGADGQPGQQGGPPDMQGQPGQMMGQPQPQQQQPQAGPIGMSLVTAVGSSEVSLASAIEASKRIARLSLAQVDDDQPGDDDSEDEYAMTPERIEALADLLAAIYGDDALDKLDTILPENMPVKLSSWSPDDHPRGPDGRFIQKGSPEAYADAKSKVDTAHRSRSAESMRDLMTHMNTLTVSQLHKLKKDYGTKGSAKTKAALIAKLSERLVSGRHRQARRDNDTPVAPVNEEVYSVPTASLNVDPKRFQYKVKGISGDKGVGEELKGTSKWNPELGGVLLVWRDPANDKDYVVNGHHRHELADRSNTPEVNVRYIDAPDAKQARAKGALANIAEGRGTALDAAKYLRDSDRGIDHLRDAGISMSGKVAADAEQLTKLGNKSFQAVTNGLLSEDKAIAVAKWLPDTNLQDKLFKKLANREEDGKDWTLREIEQAAKKMDRAGKITTSGTDLFGDFEDEESTFDQEVELESYITRQLSQEANDFGAVANTRRAERVADAGNTLATDENAIRRDAARQQLSTFERESGLRGEVSSAVKSHAARLAKAKNKSERNAIKQEAYDEIRNLSQVDNQLDQSETGTGETGETSPEGITLPTRDNDQAGDGDQLGLWGEVANVARGKPTLGDTGETKGRRQNLFDTGGDPDQILLFDDDVTPDDRVWGKIAMSVMKQYGDKPGEFSLSDEEAAEVEASFRKMLDNDPKEERRAVMLSILRMARDAQGHEHKGKGPGGGQFTKGSGGGGNSPEGQTSKAKPNETQAKAPAAQPAPAKATVKDIPGTDIESESTTPPPPGKANHVNVEAVGEHGVTLTSRVGVPGNVVPPPPKIPKLPNLTASERRAETDFISAFESDPHKMAADYRSLIASTDKPYTFEVDQAKQLSRDWMDDDLPTQMKKRQLNNNALHQTANAIVKKAFLQHLDTLKPGDGVLVTVGGCGSGKGYTLKNTDVGKNLTAESKAVWDSAGDQNATENPWILDEASKRGLVVTYAYVAGDPKVAWADPGRGVVTRAHDPKDGRMVDAAVFADSYVLGAKNHHAFSQANKSNPNAKFLFFDAKDQSVIDGVPHASLNVDRKALYHWAMGSIQSRSDVSPAVMRGGTQGARIWNDEFGG